MVIKSKIQFRLNTSNSSFQTRHCEEHKRHRNPVFFSLFSGSRRPLRGLAMTLWGRVLFVSNLPLHKDRVPRAMKGNKSFANSCRGFGNPEIQQKKTGSKSLPCLQDKKENASSSPLIYAELPQRVWWFQKPEKKEQDEHLQAISTSFRFCILSGFMNHFRTASRLLRRICTFWKGLVFEHNPSEAALKWMKAHCREFLVILCHSKYFSCILHPQLQQRFPHLWPIRTGWLW